MTLPGLAAALIATSFLSGPALAFNASPEATPEVKQAYEQAANEVLCYCGCARQTIKDCSCSIAFDLRTEWEGRIAAGATADQIVEGYIAEHGEQTRNSPPRKGLNLLAWFGPGIAIVLAAGVTFLLLSVWAARGRRAAAAAVGEGSEGSGPGAAPSNDADRDRLERELREFEQ